MKNKNQVNLAQGTLMQGALNRLIHETEVLEALVNRVEEFASRLDGDSPVEGLGPDKAPYANCFLHNTDERITYLGRSLNRLSVLMDRLESIG